MHTVIKKNEYIDQYNWSSLITQEDNQQLMFIAKDIIDSGDYFENSPKFQTKQNLFARPEPIFLKMRQSFIYSCFMFLNREVRIKNIMSWVFMTNNQTTENRDIFWHNHHVSDNNGTTDTLSGIWYVHIPTVAEQTITGTEYSMSGPPNFEDTFFLEPNSLTWNIYPSKLWHRPGICDSIDYRFVFAADMEYYK
jgi:hypothetical protein